MTYKRFPAKVLLFGEHFLLRGASALAMPVQRYGGHWAWGEPMRTRGLQGRLQELAQSDALRALPQIDSQAFMTELSRGIWFRTNIPSGYGLGSSGALSAGVYERYCREKAEDPTELKRQLAQVESFFHGRSSGIDPLTSYLGTPIFIENGGIARQAELPDFSKNLKIYLLDTRQSRKTGTLIRQFADLCNIPDFSRRLDNFLANVHEPMLQQFLNGDFDAFWENLRELSIFQWQYMRFMIPENVRYRWENGLERGDFYLKICGAGGGGFILAFVRDAETGAFLERLHRLVAI